MVMMGDGRRSVHLMEVKVELVMVRVFVRIDHLLCGLRWLVWWIDGR